MPRQVGTTAARWVCHVHAAAAAAAIVACVRAPGICTSTSATTATTVAAHGRWSKQGCRACCGGWGVGEKYASANSGSITAATQRHFLSVQQLFFLREVMEMLPLLRHPKVQLLLQLVVGLRCSGGTRSRLHAVLCLALSPCSTPLYLLYALLPFHFLF